MKSFKFDSVAEAKKLADAESFSIQDVVSPELLAQLDVVDLYIALALWSLVSIAFVMLAYGLIRRSKSWFNFSLIVFGAAILSDYPVYGRFLTPVCKNALVYSGGRLYSAVESEAAINEIQNLSRVHAEELLRIGPLREPPFFGKIVSENVSAQAELDKRRQLFNPVTETGVTWEGNALLEVNKYVVGNTVYYVPGFFHRGPRWTKYLYKSARNDFRVGAYSCGILKSINLNNLNK